MLNAPRELLRALNVHIVGKVSENIEDDIIQLKNESGDLECVVAAVPFLRDQDIRRSVSGESSQERIERIKEGIYNHYEAMGKAAKAFAKKGVPIIATGHLYAKGAEASDAKSQSNIYIQNRENISAEQFPKVFDYVALGHIHRAQALGGQEHVRYSGSIIPLRFKETLDTKTITIIEFDGKKRKAITEVGVPEFRRLKIIEGDLDKVKASLERFAAKDTRLLTPWVEIIVETDKIIPNLDLEIKTFTKEMNLEIIKVRSLRRHHALTKKALSRDLEELDPLDVFRKKCESNGTLPDDIKELEATFAELRSWMTEREE